MDGLLVLDKPAGPSSHAVVLRVRRLLSEKRIGHTGTLDPAASGVLPLVLGRATRLARFLTFSDKAYDAIVELGRATTTFDAAGDPVGLPYAGPLPDRETIDRALDAFRGSFLQSPPAYSAKKVDGERSYIVARRAARRGDEAVTAPAPVRVSAYSLALSSIDGHRMTLHIECSAGFYVRALAHDLGARLGTGAHLAALRRTRSGDLTLTQAVSLADIEDPVAGRAAANAAVIPMARMLPAMEAVVLTDDGVGRAVHGRELRPVDARSGFPAGAPDQTAAATPVRLLTPGGDLVGVASRQAAGVLHPLVVLM